MFPINFEIWKDDLNEFASNVVKIRKLKFLEALELDSGKVLRLLNVCQYPLIRLRRISIYRSLREV